jgi:hypothetical protein
MLNRGDKMITCLIRYVIDPDKLEEFEAYGRMWMPLVEKFGGTHHGYFLPQAGPSKAAPFSFPGLATDGPRDVAVALFSFPDMEAYESYRRKAAEDKECRAAMAYYDETKCFLSYERTFLRPVFK